MILNTDQVVLELSASLPIEALSVQYNVKKTGLSSLNDDKSVSYKWPRFCNYVTASNCLK
jgi:hypothetical protein